MAVLVFADGSEGKIKKASKEAVYYASKVAEKTGGETVAVALGKYDDSELAALGKVGANKVLHVDDERLAAFNSQAYTKALAKAVESAGANVVVGIYNNSGKAILPRLSARLKAGLIPGAIALPNTDGGFSVTKGVFSGKGFAEYTVNTDKKIIGVNQNTLQVEEGEGTATVEKLSVDFDENDFSVKVKEVKKSSEGVPLTDAELVVSAGRGLKGPENWGMVEELAETLGAATACSRPVADVGWRPHHEHVGQTGHTVRPNLYIAIAISGAIQHLAGVSGSKTIVVINKDPEAPFFKAADYGVVGDAFEVVPKLNESFKKFLQNNQ